MRRVLVGYRLWLEHRRVGKKIEPFELDGDSLSWDGPTARRRVTPSAASARERTHARPASRRRAPLAYGSVARPSPPAASRR